MESKVQSYGRNFPCVLDRALGAEVWDLDGRRYLDFLAGAGSLNYGHSNPILKAALLSYIESDSIAHSLDLYTAAKLKFLEAMRDIVLKPRGLDYVLQFTGPTGANAVEAALKLARKVTGRSNVICFTNGFHGVSAGALSATGNLYNRGAAGLPLYGTVRMPFENYCGASFDTIEYIDHMLSDPSSGIDHPAAMLVETIQGEGGLNTATSDWLRRLYALCEGKGILLIVDDIQAGCGRTGSFFSFESAGIKPDMVTLSKSLSGYGLPLSVVLIRRELDAWKPGEHNGTFRGNNHAFVTATAMLQRYWQTGEFAEEVRAKGDRLERRLHTWVSRFSPHVLETRGRGMMRGVRCRDPKRAQEIAARAFREGVIIERCGPQDEVIKCMMPLTIPLHQLDEGLDIIEHAMSAEFESEGTGIVAVRQPEFASVAAE
jgi:diaminobutyrate-2-oxoglutarate transaminase